VPGVMSWLQPGQMYVLVASNGWTVLTSTASSDHTGRPQQEGDHQDESGGEHHVVDR
jgi:hypothetical protein